MRVSELWGRFAGNDIYVVGTGPSMRYFPLRFLEGRVTIGLNQAWRYCPLSYSVTIHPELITSESHTLTKWIVKEAKAPLRAHIDDPRYYVFRAGGHHGGADLGHLRKRSDHLYQGRGIQQTAMNIAAHMGARSIVLVGVDMCELGGAHHGHDQHVRFCGLAPEAVYREYRDFTDHVRRIVRDELGIPVLTLSPFIGLRDVEEDATRLRIQLGITESEPPKDLSTYTRSRTDSPRSS
jgi:hypothetical protein